jgi:hypothetical protein
MLHHGDSVEDSLSSYLVLELSLLFSLHGLRIFLLTPVLVSGQRWSPLMVARSWHRTWLEEILSTEPGGRSRILPSPYLSLPLMSIVKIAR